MLSVLKRPSRLGAPAYFSHLQNLQCLSISREVGFPAQPDLSLAIAGPSLSEQGNVPPSFARPGPLCDPGVGVSRSSWAEEAGRSRCLLSCTNKEQHVLRPMKWISCATAHFVRWCRFLMDRQLRNQRQMGRMGSGMDLCCPLVGESFKDN